MSNLPGTWEWPEGLPRERKPIPTPTTNPPATDEQEPPQPAPRDTPNSNTSSGTSGNANTRQKHWGPRTCRICLETVLPTFQPPSENLPGFMQPGPRVTYDSEGGHLLRPCKCKGSVKYVHEQCLQQWRYADPSMASRNYYHCPTCGFQYKLSRLGWGNLISSVAAQITLTILIFLFTIFVLGFVADPIINFCLDPSSLLWRFFGGDLYYPREQYYDPDPEPTGWIEHFTKGFASLGLASFFKAMIASPLQFWLRSSGHGGRRGGQTGRDRLSSATWMLIILGALTFMYTVWKGVRVWSARTLQKAGERVMDVQGEDEGDDDD